MIVFSLKEDIVEFGVGGLELSGLLFELLESVDGVIQKLVKTFAFVFVFGSLLLELFQLNYKLSITVIERLLFCSCCKSLFFSIYLFEAIIEAISVSLFSHILFSVEFSLTVSSICTVTLWICIFRLSTSLLMSDIFFLFISISSRLHPNFC